MKRVIAIVIFALIVCFSAIAAFQTVAVIRCNDAANEMEVPTKFSMVSGCYYQLNNQWYPL